jgi:hypothetical protein
MKRHIERWMSFLATGAPSRLRAIAARLPQPVE